MIRIKKSILLCALLLISHGNCNSMFFIFYTYIYKPLIPMIPTYLPTSLIKWHHLKTLSENIINYFLKINSRFNYAIIPPKIDDIEKYAIVSVKPIPTDPGKYKTTFHADTNNIIIRGKAKVQIFVAPDFDSNIITIEANDDIQKNIITETINNTLVIEQKQSDFLFHRPTYKKEEITYNIFIKSLSSITLYDEVQVCAINGYSYKEINKYSSALEINQAAKKQANVQFLPPLTINLFNQSRVEGYRDPIINKETTINASNYSCCLIANHSDKKIIINGKDNSTIIIDGMKSHITGTLSGNAVLDVGRPRNEWLDKVKITCSGNAKIKCSWDKFE